MKRVCSIASVVLIILFLVGCASKKSDSDSEIKSHEFIFVCPIVDVEYWQDCAAGIAKADAELGTVTQVLGPNSPEDYAAEILDYMADAIEAKPDAIMTYAGIHELTPLIDQAVDAGIPVLAIDSDNPASKRAAYVGTSLYALGYRAGETMVQLTGGNAKVGYLCSTLSSESESLVFGAFQDALVDYDMDVVAKVEAGISIEQTQAAAATMLAEHPEISAVFCTSAYTATGIGRVKESQGLDELKIVGLDDVEENLELVRSGSVDALLVQSPYQMGYQGVHLLHELVSKGALPHDSYDTGSVLVTKDNVDSYKNP